MSLNKKSQSLINWDLGNEPGPHSNPITLTPQAEPSKEKTPNTGSSEIIKMQQVILDFANTVSAHDAFSKTPTSTEFNSLNSFITNKYTHFTNSENSENYLRSVIDSMKHIGNSNISNKPDGDWGKRTNIALRNIYGFSSALFKFANDSGIQIKEFSNEDLKTFFDLLPRNDDIKSMPILDKIEKAPLITAQIEKLKAFYKEFEDKVLNQNKEYFTGNKSTKAHNISKTINLAGQDVTKPVVYLNNVPVTLENLQTAESFQNLLKKVNMDAKDALDEISKILKSDYNPEAI